MSVDGVSYAESALGQWLIKKGGHISPNLIWRKEGSGHRLEASETISSENDLVVLPYHLAITPRFVRELLPSDVTSDLPDHPTMCLYLVLLDLAIEGRKLPEGIDLMHEEYARMLPKKEQMRTAMWFNEQEVDLLKGSNLYGAIQVRRHEWQREREEILAKKAPLLGLTADDIPWERYLWAASTLSARAFPSYLLDGVRENATQILLPCIDAFNHKRAQPITWFSDHRAKQMKLSTVVPVEKGEEVFNNYGAKPNDELLLGYGFLLEDNPEDFVSVKLGTNGDPRTAVILQAFGLPLSTPHYIKRGATELPTELLAQMRILVASDGHLKSFHDEVQKGSGRKSPDSEHRWKVALDWLDWDNELEMVDQLGNMLIAKAQGLKEALQVAQSGEPPRKKRRTYDQDTSEQEDPAEWNDGADVRPDVRRMIEGYLKGQHEIMERSTFVLDELLETVTEKALADGWDVYGDEDPSSDEEGTDPEDPDGEDLEMPSGE